MSLGRAGGLPPKTITLAEINTRMNGEADGFRFIFEPACPSTASLSDWRRRLRTGRQYQRRWSGHFQQARILESCFLQPVGYFGESERIPGLSVDEHVDREQ